MTRLLTASVVILGLFAGAEAAQAQVPYQRYLPPSGPALPIYLDYFRPQSGVLDQYNQFVGPKGRLDNQLRTMVQQQNLDYGTLETQIQKGGQIRASRAAPTGTAAGFMNYSHYFQQRNSAAAAHPRQLPGRYR